ncbi:MAG: hypothetical protein ABJM38_01680, partial [Nitratireductor sp.]
EGMGEAAGLEPDIDDGVVIDAGAVGLDHGSLMSGSGSHKHAGTLRGGLPVHDVGKPNEWWPRRPAGRIRLRGAAAPPLPGHKTSEHSPNC